MKRRLTRANVKEKIKETRRVLAKLRFLAKEVPLLLGTQFLSRRGTGGRGHWAGRQGSHLLELQLFLFCLSLLCQIPSSSCWELQHFLGWLLRGLRLGRFAGLLVTEQGSRSSAVGGGRAGAAPGHPALSAWPARAMPAAGLRLVCLGRRLPLCCPCSHQGLALQTGCKFKLALK